MQRDAMVRSLRSLKLHGKAQAAAELAEREVRSVAYQMKIARFPTYRVLASFDFMQSPANEAVVR